MPRIAVQLAVLVAIAVASPAAHAQFIVAHRGASHDAPENTLAAFNLAWKQGADGIEGDFYLSSDGKIICFHDKDTERVAGVKHVVKDTSFDVLRRLDVGAWKDERFRGERPPTLEEVMATVPQGKMFFIELKTGPEIVTPLRKAILASPLTTEQMIIICFNEDTVAECEKQMPELKSYWLTGYKEKDGKWTPTREEVAARLHKSHADGFGSEAQRKVATKEFLERLCADGLGCDFHVWTVDDPKVARYYQRLGAWGITTNRPAWLRKQLKLPAAAGAN